MRKPDPFFATLNRLLGWNQHPRNGKVARLPEPTRTRINQMLENGLPTAPSYATSMKLRPSPLHSPPKPSKPKSPE